MARSERGYTTSTAFLEALAEAGVRYVFANLGSDHPGLVEAYARARDEGRADELPELVICPHESVALSAAQGYAQASGQPQAVIVHVDCGTQNLGGTLHNVAKARVPVLIFAGASPVTQEGELPGGRNEFIHWIQDVPDQRGIVRGYTKYDNEIRTGRNVKQLVHRAIQIACSEPAGPVYLVGAREVMEEHLTPAPGRPELFTPVTSGALAPEVAGRIADALAGARNPVVVTSNLGREPDAVVELVRLCERLAIRVIESVPMYVNFPADHPLHAGYQWNTPAPNPALAEADVILVLGCEVPWIPSLNRPAEDARVFVVDADPLKERTPLWHVPAELYARANPGLAARQLADAVAADSVRTDEVAARYTRSVAEHDRRAADRARRTRPRPDVITPEYLAACVHDVIDDETIVLSEAITNFGVVSEFVPRSVPGTLFGSGGSSLGWHAGAAIGVKLAVPDRLVVSLVGDGTYLFGVPASASWMSRRYGAPNLTVIIDNQGWRAPKLSTLAVHPDGVAAANDDFGVGFAPGADLPGVAAAAGGAWARTVVDPAELPALLTEAVKVVRDGRSAVLSARVPAL
ncbi:thiamine pyrophosphate-requiring protein [Amycolatopsis sp. YIM 10]|uniref:thiamine pyrophosphate-requiring protein n=1 Tax=Amycolatopsis sp. YIM 10 TaxID=2653857 RepID=UPI00128FDC34|nr:thiamine pyrophosphate-requiring protein [Amycolatopsis sp. YIM 10]QFU89619.1 Benzoylformate decarboxylase [Amycolatopsis sp. YIM 10]